MMGCCTGHQLDLATFTDQFLQVVHGYVQQLLWAGREGTNEFSLDREPDRLWTLRAFDPDRTPRLPYSPQHHRNAMIENDGHDYSWRRGVLRYRGQNNGRCWVLLEYAAP